MRVIFLSVGLRIYFSLRKIETYYNQMDTFTMIKFFLGNTIGVKEKIFLKTILLRNVSFPHVLRNISWQLNYPPLT